MARYLLYLSKQIKTGSLNMARPQRLLINQLPHLVYYQSLNQRKAFSSPEDYQQYLQWLQEEAAAYKCILHAYLFLPKQIYLIVEPTYGKDISKIMQALGRRYVRYLNLKEKLSGTLWKDRFKSSPLKTDYWLNNAQHYLAYKPVAEGLCKDPEDYFWSSYKENLVRQPSALKGFKLAPSTNTSTQLEIALSRNKPLE